MRKVIKNLNDIPNSLGNCDTHLDRIIKERKNRSTKKIKAQFNIYSGIESDVESVKYKLKKIYKNKCAFCESTRDEMTVDHYRPKDLIKGGSELGYFWLCYEWSNLLYACSDCNENHKGTKFPILGSYFDFRTKSPAELKSDINKLNDKLNVYEKPLILNPEEKYFSPERYIKFDRDGKPSGIDIKGRGTRTIEDCGLDKTILNGKRKEKLDRLITFAMAQLVKYPDKYNDSEMKEEFKNILEDLICDPSEEFTLFYKWSIKLIKEFVYDHPKLKKLPENGKFKQNLKIAIEEKFKVQI